MEFKVYFTAKDDKYIVKLPEKRQGLNALDKARKALPDLAIADEDMHPRIEALSKKEVCVRISEDTARKAGLFQDETAVFVTTPTEWANNFYDEKVVANIDDEENNIEVKLMYDLNTGKCIEEWKKLGFPLNIEEA